MGMFFILRSLAQVGACPKDKKNPPREPLEILLLDHHLRRSASLFKPSQRPNLYQVEVHLRLQEHSIVKQTPRTYSDSIFDDPHMDRKIIL
jgi:hypothetical protein